MRARLAGQGSLSAQISAPTDGRPIALVVDSYVPFDDRSAGAKRIAAIIRMMYELGWHVIFVPDEGHAYEPYAERLRAIGVQVVPHRGDRSQTLDQLKSRVDLAWVCRPELAERWFPLLKRRSGAKLVFDTVDLHFLRLRRQSEVTGKQTGWERMQRRELALMGDADATVVTSDAERDRLADYGIGAITIPIPEDVRNGVPDPDSRHSLLFLGNYSHEPNVDAAGFLVEQIMPLVWRESPVLRLVLAGAEPVPRVRRFASARVSVSGFAHDLQPVFDDAMVFLAPLRFGAGLKGKIVEALARGVPIVTTTIGAEGLGLRHERNALIADDAPTFASAILSVCRDRERWLRLSAAGLRAAETFSSERVRERLRVAIERIMADQHESSGARGK